MSAVQEPFIIIIIPIIIINYNNHLSAGCDSPKNDLQDILIIVV